MSFPFDPNQGPILVKGEISGPLGAANLQLLLDTGATTSLIRPTILISVGDDPDASPDRIAVTMGGGTTTRPRLVLNRLTALGHHRIGFPVPSSALPPESGVDGLLGLDFLRGTVLTIDFSNGRIDVT